VHRLKNIYQVKPVTVQGSLRKLSHKKNLHVVNKLKLLLDEVKTMCRLREIAGFLFILIVVSQPVAGSESLLTAAMEGDAAKLQSLLNKGADVNTARADGVTALLEAIFYNNNPHAIDVLIRAGADVNVSDSYGVNLLHLACLNRDAELVQKLLSKGADANRAKITGETPLLTCSNTGTIDGVSALLTHGAKVNAKESKEDQTALMWASSEGYGNVVNLLVDAGADVHARSRTITLAKPHIVEYSLDLSVWGSNYPTSIRWHEVAGAFTALHFAARNGKLETARVLLDGGANINDTHPEHGNALMIAIASGHEDLALFLLKNGADPNVKDPWGATPLHFALHKGLLNLNGVKSLDNKSMAWHREDMPVLVETLLDYGADPNAKIKYELPYLDDPFLARNASVPAQISPIGATPLLLAAASGNLQAINILEEVSNVNETTIGGATLFMLAAGAGAESKIRSEEEALEAAKHVLDLGVTNVNAYLTDIVPGGPGWGKVDGRTALHFATYYKWPKMIKFLVENGADVNVEDRYGVTPLMLALGDPEGRLAQNVGEFNNDHRFRRPGGARQSAGDSNNELAELLLELGATPCVCKAIDLTGR
jgi:ankyrin repeat protein